MTPADTTGRFDQRADAYERGRPAYPRELYAWLEARLAPAAVIADLGSGTGIFCRPLLERGHTVFAVEPNADMRAIAEHRFERQAAFVSVAASAEATGLDSGSIDLATSAQAFHWFDFDAVRAELERILRADGAVLVVWNSRRLGGAPFLDAYEQFLERWGTDYESVRQRWRASERLPELFPHGSIERVSFENRQLLDLPGLLARLESSSYIPGAGQPRYQAMRAAAATLFDVHEENGRVKLEYDTEAYVCGRE